MLEFTTTYISLLQCDQMLEKKVAQFFHQKLPKSSQCSFYIRVRFFKIAQKVANHLASADKNFVPKNFEI